MHRTPVKKVVVENVLDANDTLAAANRDAFDRTGTYAINMMSSPGAGKTALLERTLERLRGRLRLGVLEGDVQTTLDAQRLSRFHIPLIQVNTDPGFGGECHLDANMVRSGLGELPLDDIDILIIENVGNLVCPAEFRVGEDVRVMVYSVTEGEEKPLKYPLMFRSADLVLVNKVDLLEHLDFDLEEFLDNLDTVNPGVRRILTSARTGQGVDEWCDWLGQRQEGV
jgi:hydrogenase nickel incorporation protein HypB